GNPAESGPGTGVSAPAPATRREHSRRRHRRRRLLREAAAIPETESRSASGTVGDLASPDGASPAGGPRVGRPRDKRPRQADTQERGTRRDYSREQRGRSGEPRDGRERAPDHRRQGSRARGPRGARATDPHQARGRDAQQKKSEQKLYALEAVVDRGFDDVVEEAGEGVARRVHWTILKRTVADQKSGKPMSAVYVLQREGNNSEYPNLAAARAAVNKTIVHPEKLTMSKAEHAAAKK
ncbi:MAG: hypothetical protein J2P48_14090, partial [Alphaproteobacteria bacterium]|nr:hypothetical protein [Alphaproteobacteria bacterium]